MNFFIASTCIAHVFWMCYSSRAKSQFLSPNTPTPTGDELLTARLVMQEGCDDREGGDHSPQRLNSSVDGIAAAQLELRSPWHGTCVCQAFSFQEKSSFLIWKLIFKFKCYSDRRKRCVLTRCNSRATEREKEPAGHPVGWQDTQGAAGGPGKAPTLGLGRSSVADPWKAW